MHIRTGSYLLPLDTELEKSIKNLKKEKAVAETSMADQGKCYYNNPYETSTKAKNNGGFLDTSDKGRLLNSEATTHRCKQF